MTESSGPNVPRPKVWRFERLTLSMHSTSCATSTAGSPSSPPPWAAEVIEEHVLADDQL